MTLVITTHYMDEAEQLCDRLVVMDKGLIVAEGSPRELIEPHSTREVAELRFGVGEHEALAEKLADLGNRIEVLPDRLLVYSDDGEGGDRPDPRARSPAGGGPGAPLHPRGRLPPAHRPDAWSTDVHAHPRARAPAPVRLLVDRLQAHLEGAASSAAS